MEIDKYIKARKPVRMAFTKTYNLLEQHTDLENTQDMDEEMLQPLLTKMERLGTEMAALDEKVLELLLEQDTDAYNSEYETIDSYRDKLDSARLKVSNRMQSIINARGRGFDSSSLSASDSKKQLKLPKIEFIKFGGDVKEWLGFWGQFKRIHEDKDIEVEDKFQYLIQATKVGSRARELVNSFPPTAENYHKAIESLVSRFGREDLLTEYYVRELISLVVLNVANKKEKADLAALYDNLEAQLRALESIGVTRDRYGAMLFPLVESCLPEGVLRVWMRNHSTTGAEQVSDHADKLGALLVFLKGEVEGEERITIAQAGFGLNRKRESDKFKVRKSENGPLPTASVLFTSRSEGRKGCIFCKKQHENKECHLAQELNLDDKRKRLAENKCCFVCLKIGHRATNCTAKLRCPVCGNRHEVIMCPRLEVNKLNNKIDVKPSDRKPKKENEGVVALNTQATAAQEVLLQTLSVRLKYNGKEKTVRALIDCGSQRSYLLERTALEMRYVPLRTERIKHNLFGGSSISEREHHLYEISISSCHNSKEHKIQVLDQRLICGKIPRLQYGPWLDEIKERNIWISDFGPDPPVIELLIGADAAGSLFTKDIVQLKSGLVAIRTSLGWTVMGKLWQKIENSDSTVSMVNSLFVQSMPLQELWSLETIGIRDPIETLSRQEMEFATLKHFQDNVMMNEEGRYEVALPWKDSRQLMKGNKYIALKRLCSATDRLIKKGNFERYQQVFQEWETEGIIEEVHEEEIQDAGYYLPHRGVFKDGATTAVRPVFDASCKSKGGPSLNDCLEKGPNLLEIIPAILARFRLKRIGVISDIKKAFLQISVRKADRHFLKFLWWENLHERKVKVYRHNRVVFGINCSPFLLGAVLDLHLKNNGSDFPETARKLRSSLYVDNCVTSVETEEELNRFIDESRKLLASVKFDLRGWEHTRLMLKEDEMLKITPVLGLFWDPVADVLSCKGVDLIGFDEKVTRRSVLSMSQSIFDPIGFTCPISIVPKILLQESWQLKMSWDHELSEDMKNRFNKWRKDLHTIRGVKVSRQLASSEYGYSWSLHTFCDASQVAYAAAVFLRSFDGREINIQLVSAKSRVAPIKKTTIPRLELLACTIGSRLTVSAMNSLGLTNIPAYYWSDSSTALCWIKRGDAWGTFVANRVKEIRALTDPVCWFHVAGMDNPADLPSRGCSVSQLIASKWWEGPAWLKLQENEWPTTVTLTDEDEVNIERRKGIATTLMVSKEEPQWYLRYFSKYSKVVRMLAWMLRFVNNAKGTDERKFSSELSFVEINFAERKLLKVLQAEVFTDGDNFKTLSIFKDQMGLLRVKTKITRRKDQEDFRTPILLPSNHPLTELVIREEHLRASHAGVQILLSILREHYWIPKGRRSVRKVIGKCVRCRRFVVKKPVTEPIALPEDRVRDAAVFEVVGVDLAGPLFLKDRQKAWIVIFTCAVFRAVHFELVLTMSTAGFLQALRRFIARRGRPRIVYSDNGTNFVGASSLLDSIDWEKVCIETSLSRIEWRFNPPTAAWWGGFWERIVQMIKKLLRRVLGRAALTYEELLTVLTDGESLINSRPLTYVSDGCDDLVPLTPSMFLQDIPAMGVPDLDCIDKVNLSSRFQYLQQLRGDLRRRFRVEYLGQLLQRPKDKKSPHQEPKVGDVVIIGSDDTRRIDWPLGKIVAVYPGKDGVIRVVRVRTSSGEFVRPIQHVYPMEAGPAGVDAEHTELPIQSDTEVSPSADRSIVTRSGRRVKLPSRLDL